jgi:hypothetical protein
MPRTSSMMRSEAKPGGSSMTLSPSGRQFAFPQRCCEE